MKIIVSQFYARYYKSKDTAKAKICQNILRSDNLRDFKKKIFILSWNPITRIYSIKTHDKFVVKVSSYSTKPPTRIEVRGEWNDHLWTLRNSYLAGPCYSYSRIIDYTREWILDSWNISRVRNSRENPSRCFNSMHVPTDITNLSDNNRE